MTTGIGNPYLLLMGICFSQKPLEIQTGVILIKERVASIYCGHYCTFQYYSGELKILCFLLSRIFWIMLGIRRVTESVGDWSYSHFPPLSLDPTECPPMDLAKLPEVRQAFCSSWLEPSPHIKLHFIYIPKEKGS